MPGLPQPSDEDVTGPTYVKRFTAFVSKMIKSTTLSYWSALGLKENSLYLITTSSWRRFRQHRMHPDLSGRESPDGGSVSAPSCLFQTDERTWLSRSTSIREIVCRQALIRGHRVTKAASAASGQWN